MCVHPEASQEAKKGTRRLKLWETKPHFHCSILGTCLSLDELNKAKRQAGIILEGMFTDYDLHVAMVRESEENNRSGRCLHKMLEKKYRRAVKSMSKCKTPEQLTELWDEALQTRDIAGAYWALMTHPQADFGLLSRAFGEVHMMSHLQGAAHRKDIRQSQEMEEEVARLQSVLTDVRGRDREQVAARESRIQQLEQQVLTLMTKPSLDAAAKSVSGMESDLDESKRQLDLMTERLNWAEQRLSQREVQLDEKEQDVAAYKELLVETKEENMALEKTIQAVLGSDATDGSDDCSYIDLDGCHVLYVGGHSSLTPHFKQLVEKQKGNFSYHDGGLEDGAAQLSSTLAKADMVFCPVDCVSHAAIIRVKRACKQQAKPFIPLRSSGLSAFTRGLTGVTDIQLSAKQLQGFQPKQLNQRGQEVKHDG